MERAEHLTENQLAWLLWAGLLSHLVKEAPAALLPLCGRAAWLSCLLTMAAALPLSAMLGAFLRARKPGEGLGEVLLRALGPGAGRRLLLGLGLWLSFCTGVSLRTGGERMAAAVYPESPGLLFAFGTLISALGLGLGRRRTLGRCAEIASALLLGLLLSVTVLALPAADWGELVPQAEDIRASPLGALPLLGTVSAGGFFALLTGGTEIHKPGRLLLGPLLSLCAVGMILTVLVLGAFGPALAGEMDYAFFVLLRNLELPHLLERGEALAAAAWVISDVLLTAAQLHMVSLCLTLALRGPGKERRAQSVWAAAALAGVWAAGAAPDVFSLLRLGREVIPLADLCIVWGLLPAALIFGKWRKRL